MSANVKSMNAGVIALAILMLVASPTSADEASPTARLGLSMETLRVPGQVPASHALAELHARLESGLDETTDELDRGALHFMLAEVSLASGRADAARRYLESADDGLEASHLADDLDRLRARTLELAGDDTKADKLWSRWLARHDDSPLRVDVGLHRVWNAIRRHDPKEARKRLDALQAEYPWLTDARRARVASATIEWMSGSPASALAVLDPKGARGPMEGYLTAMCLEAEGKILPAAAAFQEVANRYPNAPLRDHALFRKADLFRRTDAFRSAAEEFQRLANTTGNAGIRSEASFRQALCHFLDGDSAPAEALLTELAAPPMGPVTARAQYLLAELRAHDSRFPEAIEAFTRVLTQHFEHDLAPRAQYRIGRCLDSQGRSDEATSSYMAVVEGYPQSPEAPAAAYLAGVGLIDRGQPRAAVPHFQLLLDRYGERVRDGSATDAERELLGSARYHLLVAFRHADDPSLVASADLEALTRGEPDTWNVASRLLIADALASQHRFADAERLLEPLTAWDGDVTIGVAAGRLLAWVYAQQGREDLAIATEQAVLERFDGSVSRDELATARLNRGHMLFNEKAYEDAVAVYESFVHDYPEHSRAPSAVFQAGICYLRLDRAGDAVDRWERVIADEPTSEVALSAASRAADVYFHAEDYASASRHFAFLAAGFPDHPIAARASLGEAHCAYNQGLDDDALRGYSAFLDRFPDDPLAPEAEKGIEMTLYRLGQGDGGVARLAELVEQYPNSGFAGDAQLDIATRLYADERFSDAATAYRRVVSQFPSHSSADRAQFFMCEALVAAGSIEEARSGYEQFLVFFPSSELYTTTQFRLGSLWFDAGEHMRAALHFTTVLGADPDIETRQASLYNLALCERALNRPDDALAHLEELGSEGLVHLTPVEVEYQMGEIHAGSGRHAAAVRHYESALAGGPEPESAAALHFGVASAHEALGATAAALAAYEKAAAAESTEFRVPALTRCALLYEENDDMRSALRIYRALARTSTDAELVAAAEQRAAELETVVQ